MSKPLCLIRAPIETRSGYGEAARDICRHVIEYNKYDVLIHSVPWGDTPMNVLDETCPNDKILLDRILKENLTKQPDLFISITVPNEFQPSGKFNIGITAGIETSVPSPEWVLGCNQMDTVWFMSEFGKRVFDEASFTKNDPNGHPIGELRIEKPLDVLHNCIDTNVYKKLSYDCDLEKTILTSMNDIPEKFIFLFVGHWLRGEFGEDRKNVGLLIKVFLEVFRLKKTEQPALLLKTSGAGFSILDQEEILKKINTIKNTVILEEGQTMPSIYVLHGELTDAEMNSLYNHPRIKAHVSFTKGEGFCRPLLEASLSGKPIIASGWSGHLDFLNPEEALLVGGELKPIHPSALWENVIIKEATWFSPDPNQAANALYGMFMDYANMKRRIAPLAKKNRTKFNYEAIKAKTFELLDKYVPIFPETVEIKLPKLKKIE